MTANTPDIKLHDVASSQISRIGYDPGMSRLRVQFKQKGLPGPVYEYQNVDIEQYRAFYDSPSKGKHFAQHFKGNERHPHRKIG